MLFHKLYALNCRKEELQIYAVGAAQVAEGLESFDVGAQNIKMLRFLFERAGLKIKAEGLGDDTLVTSI